VLRRMPVRVLYQKMYSVLRFCARVFSLSDVFGLCRFVLIYYGLGRVLVVFA